MGIKFLCPNGHKLHVKSFLAGKRAICPKCGERVIVPAEDDGNSSDVATTSSEGAAGDVGTASVEIPMLSEPSAPEPAIVAHRQNPAVPLGVQPSASTPTMDPIDEVPSAVWYVRPATGGQFGPASGEIMRNWVRDGRVGASSLIWRAGWEEWRSATEIFPELKDLLSAPLASAGAGSGPMPSLPQGQALSQATSSRPLPVESSESPRPQAIRKRRRRNEVSLMTSGILLAVALILLVVLALVFRSQMATEEPGPLAAPATAAP